MAWIVYSITLLNSYINYLFLQTYIVILQYKYSDGITKHFTEEQNEL
jgi:5-methylcytosine-specific restriction endonuclease McrBC GTP-binding regulatory subunit McrB